MAGQTPRVDFGKITLAARMLNVTDDCVIFDKHNDVDAVVAAYRRIALRIPRES